MSYAPSLKPNTRIDVADILRGIAIGGIVLIHFIEHLNFYLFPEPSSPFMATLNQNVWDTTFFLLAGKMYAIFSMLFGLSFFIQHDNQAQLGVDFRPRFLWRICGHPLEAPRIAAALVHDWLYRAQLTDRGAADDIFNALCKEVGMGWWRTGPEWAALKAFGWAAWNDNRKWPRIVQAREMGVLEMEMKS